MGRNCLATAAVAVFVCWMTISGCSGAPATPTLTSAPDRVGVSPSLEPYALARLAAYTQAVGVPAFDLEVWSIAEAPQAAEDGRLQLLISAAPPPEGWFATPLGAEGIAIVTNPALRTRDLSMPQLVDVFSGAVRTWDQLDGPEQPVQLVIPPQGDELRRQFEALVMGGRPFPRTATIAPMPAAMVAWVAQTPGAIGFLPLSYASEDVRTISIDGRKPTPSDLAAGGYPLYFDVVATAPEEPPDGVREWLAWLQEQE